MRPAPQKLQFYPQKKHATGRNAARAQSSTKPKHRGQGAPYLAKPSHLEPHGLIHDNMHPPYLNSKHNATTAYL